MNDQSMAERHAHVLISRIEALVNKLGRPVSLTEILEEYPRPLTARQTLELLDQFYDRGWTSTEGGNLTEINVTDAGKQANEAYWVPIEQEAAEIIRTLPKQPNNES